MSATEKNKNMLSKAELYSLFTEKDISFLDQADTLFPIRITRSWFSRIHSLEDPLAKQVFPQPKELNISRETLKDPVGEISKMPVPFVVQKHSNRALLLLSRKCHIHCRYCFRRSVDDHTEPTTEQLQKAIDYILQAGVQEVMLSGGDPLFVSNAKLASVLEQLKDIPTIRIHTRAPISFPERVQPGLLEILANYPNIWMLVHCNHVQEINAEVVEALRKIQSVGVPILNQSVLLKGVNDSVEVLAELCTKLVELRVFPYYLHHTDKVEGAEDFFVELDEGMQIYTELQRRISGVALPKYIIDPPDGSGKIDVASYIASMQR
jgi:lysine 2,3-aminomutase